MGTTNELVFDIVKIFHRSPYVKKGLKLSFFLNLQLSIHNFFLTKIIVSGVKLTETEAVI